MLIRREVKGSAEIKRYLRKLPQRAAKSFFGKTMKQILFNVSFDVQKGTCLGILGESGSGKSTLGRVICGILKPDSGSYTLENVDVYAAKEGRKMLQNRLSIVFQDYTTSANPRFRIKDIIAEGIAVYKRREKVKLDDNEEAARLLKLVGLDESFCSVFRTSSAADSCSVYALPVPWRAGRKLFCLTKQYRRLTRIHRCRLWTCWRN